MFTVDLAKIQQGDEEEFTRFVENHSQQVAKIVYRRSYHQELNEDIVQEIFLRFYKSIHTFRGESKFSTWFYGLILNTVRDYNRNFLKIKSKELAVEGEFFNTVQSSLQPEIALCAMEQRASLVKSFTKLSKVQKQVLFFIIFKGFTYEEVAQLLGCPLGTVKSRLYNARKNLKLMMK